MTSLISLLLSTLLGGGGGEVGDDNDGSVSQEEIGSSIDCPLEVEAIPGLITLLDIALYNSYENELLGIISSSHNLLAAWIDMKHQSIQVLTTLLQHSASNSINNSSTITIGRDNLIESFARTCLHSSCDAIENLTTDQLSYSANLTDPFKNTNNTTNNNTQQQQQQQQQQGNNNYYNNTTTTNGPNQQLAMSIYDSAFDTGRRIPLQQRGKDCWESSRLYCPDYINFNNSIDFSQKQLSKILHHPLITTCLTNAGYYYHPTNTTNTNNNNTTATSTSTGTSNHQQHRGVDNNNNTSSSILSSLPGLDISTLLVSILVPSEIEFTLSTLLQIICHDVPTRIIQFRSSNEATYDVMNHLYLVKVQYRAPYRAFVEAHTMVQRAPTIELVQEYIIKSKGQQQVQQQQVQQQSKIDTDQWRTSTKDQLQQLLETPELVEALVLEQQIEEIEVEISKQLLPFCDLARYIDYKRARIVISDQSILSNNYNNNCNNNTHHDNTTFTTTVGDVQQTLSRLRYLLCRTNNPGSSSSSGGGGGKRNNSSNNINSNDTMSAEASRGIRPLLLDLQGIPRLVEIQSTNYRNNNNFGTDEDDSTSTCTGTGSTLLIERRLDELIHHLQILGKLCQTRGSFRTERRTGTQQQHGSSSSNSGYDIIENISTITERGCTIEFDCELFRCYIQDWFDLVQRQHTIVATTTTSSNSTSTTTTPTKTTISFDTISELLLHAEIHVSLASASIQSLDNVHNRLQQMIIDREKRFDVLKEIIEEIALKEMNLVINLKSPNKERVLELQSTSTTGFFGIPLQMAGEYIPIG